MQRIEILRSTYLDSVSLMRISKLAGEAQGVSGAVVSMATDTNLSLMKDIGFDPGETGEVSANDLVIAIEAETQEALDGAFALVESWIKGKPAAARNTAGAIRGGTAGAAGGPGTQVAPSGDLPRNLDTAITQYPEIDLVLISVPGRYAAYEAHKALEAGKHVMIFSDNVSIPDEKRLKELGAHRGLLVMGPDCGTAIIGGVALGFANAVPRGPVGIVSASGTGAQEISSILARLGIGISHIIGTGGRDVSGEIGAVTMKMGLKALIEDEATEVIVLISKAPDPDVAEPVLELARRSNMPCIICFMGQARSERQGDLIYTGTLTEAALAAREAVAGEGVRAEKSGFDRAAIGETEIARLRKKLPKSGRYLRGLFSGGTLAQEAAFILGPRLGQIHTNLHIEGFAILDDPAVSRGHTILDLGDDVFTRGRAHPMIDQWYRLDRLEKEAADPETAVIMLDVVLGYGANPDPAGEIAALLKQTAGQIVPGGAMPPVITSICGTYDDPQAYDRQKQALEEAGAVVAETNARACEIVRDILAGDRNGR